MYETSLFLLFIEELIGHIRLTDPGRHGIKLFGLREIILHHPFLRIMIVIYLSDHCGSDSFSHCRLGFDS